MDNDKLPKYSKWFVTYDQANGQAQMLNRMYHTMRYYVKKHVIRDSWENVVGYHYTIHIHRKGKSVESQPIKPNNI